MSNVNPSKLRAEVSICEPVVTDCLTLLDVERVNAHLCCHGDNVPLVELYPVYDESGQQDETALAIEHVRFVSCNLIFFSKLDFFFFVIYYQFERWEKYGRVPVEIPNFELNLEYQYF